MEFSPTRRTQYVELIEKNAVHFSGTKCCTYEETFNHHGSNHSISKANDCICRDSFVGIANMIEYFSQCLAFFASLPSIFVLPRLVTCHNSTECYFRKQDQIGHVIGRTSIYREIDGKSSSNRGESEWIAWEGRWCCEEQYLRCGWRQRHHRCTILSVSTPHYDFQWCSQYYRQSHKTSSLFQQRPWCDLAHKIGGNVIKRIVELRLQ